MSSSGLGPFCDNLSYALMRDDDIIFREDTYRVGLLTPVFVFVGVLMAIGIPSNAVVLFVYHRQRVSYGTVKYYLMAVAMYDLSECLLGMIFEMFDLSSDLRFEVPVLCKFFNFTIAVANFGSICTLLFLNFDLYKRIVKPLSQQVEATDQRTGVIAIFVSSLVLSTPVLALFGNKETKIKTATGYDCGVRTKLRDSFWTMLTVAALTLLWALVFVIMCYIEGRLIWTIWRHSVCKTPSTHSMSSVMPPPAAAYITDKQSEPRPPTKHSIYVDAIMAFAPPRSTGQEQ